ncbi:MAG: hypothetical protein ACRD0X_04505 [Thermoanaerobaculia bacterium]
MTPAAVERSVRRQASRRLGAPAVLALVLLATAACEDTADPLPEPIILSGELARDGSVEHALSVSEAGLIAFVVENLEARDTTTGEVTALTAPLRLGLGRPDTDPDDEDNSQDEGETEEDFCDETFLAGILEGSTQVFHLEARQYCVSLADTSTTPAIAEGKVAPYTLSLTSAE